MQNGFTFADVKNKSGKYIAPTLESTSAAAEGLEVPEDLGVSTIDAPNAAAYPIVSQTFAITYADPCKAGLDENKAKGLKTFFAYLLGAGQDTIKKLSYAPIPDSLKAKDQAAVDAMQCNGDSDWELMAATSPDVRHGGRSILERSPSARRADPLFRAILMGLAALILALIAFFFVFLINKARAGAQPPGRLLVPVHQRLEPVQGDLRRLAAGRRDAHHRRRSRWSSACRSRSPPRSSSPSSRRAACAAPLVILVELLAAVPSVVYGLWGIFVLIPKLRPAEQWFSDTFAFLPFVGGNGRGAQLLHRRADPGDHDPADRLGDLARGHLDGPAGPQGGVAGARRDALGDDPDGRAAVLARRASPAPRCSASAARSARRSR